MTQAPTVVRDQGRQNSAPGSPPKKSKSFSAREARSGYWFILPAAATMALLILYPLVYGLVISFFDTNLVKRWNFVGVDYYAQALSDPVFLKSIGTTAVYSALVVTGTLIVGTILALVMNMEMRFRTLFRVILILPWLFPEVVVALLWRWMFNPIYGIFSSIFEGLGFRGDPLISLENPDTALFGVVAASIWKGYPLVMILVLAGLQSIPKDLYEAAALDGSTRLQLFRHITLPGLAPVLLVTVILETVWWFKHFTIVWLMTAGGPVDATNVVSISIYHTAFQNFQFGQAAALAAIVFLICLLASILYRRTIRDDR